MNFGYRRTRLIRLDLKTNSTDQRKMDSMYMWIKWNHFRDQGCIGSDLLISTCRCVENSYFLYERFILS